MFNFLAQTTYQYTTTTTSSGISPIVWFIYLAVVVLMVVSMWKLFEKAGKPGWASIVPIYNTYVLLEIVGRPVWWLILFFLPFVNFVVAIIVYIDLAKVFGKTTGWALLLIFLPIIGFPMLAFGDAKYSGPAEGSTPAPTPTV